MSCQDVVVFSHRRSGTHLTMDTIRNNFSDFVEPPINIDALRFPDRRRRVREQLSLRRGSSRLIMKSHAPSELDRHFVCEQARDIASRAIRGSKLIYVYRDGRDVMASLYHYIRKVRPDLSLDSFSDF